ncbi:MAG: GHKL domain-containing protein [Rhizobiaceae bacterium]|nr:GHKL domain-containing protein [Rhizobiaceae bacterium]
MTGQLPTTSNFSAGTLSGRLFLILSVWTVIAVTIIGILIAADYRNSAEQRFEKILVANVYALMGAIRQEENGNLSGSPDLGDARFQQFNSGWYWLIQSTKKPENKTSSRSLSNQSLTAPANSKFNEEFQRHYSKTGANGNEIIVLEAQVILGEGDEVFSFKVSGNKSEIDDEVANFVGRLIVILVLFGFSLVLASYFLVRLGLRPLAGATRALEDIRDGKTERIDGTYPNEVQPLIDETNALLASNKAVIERARTQVGNLAHSLKTPIAVIRNELANTKPKNGNTVSSNLILEQVAQMQNQIQIYLDRARISARHATITSRTDAGAAVKKLASVIGKLNPDLEINYSNSPGNQILFAGEESDFQEIIGNLLENASKFAATQIQIKIAKPGQDILQITIEDDGPGLSKEEAVAVLARGKRLDESKPGSGLGLSIVKDILKEYRGEMQLSESNLGGLKVELKLPSIRTE